MTSDHRSELKRKLHQELRAELEANQVSGPRAPQSGDEAAGKTAALSFIEVGRSSNALTIVNSRMNQVFAVDRQGTVNDVMGWIHRHSTLQYGGQPDQQANGVLRVDFFSAICPSPMHPLGWRVDVGPLNPIPYPNTSRARFPQAVLHVPAGRENNFADWRLVWSSACTDGNRWGNLNFGVARDLCGLGRGTSSEHSNETWLRTNQDFMNNAHTDLTMIPGGLCEGRKGEFWKLDACFTGPTEDGRYLDSLYLFKGVLNLQSNTIIWTKSRVFTIDLWRERSGVNNENFKGYMPGGANMAFSPDGRWGWAAVAFDGIEPENERQHDANPHFWYTNDFGETWNGPIRVPVRQMSEIRDNIRFTYRRDDESQIIDTSTAIPFQLSDHDMIVDKDGNPHFVAVYANAANASPNSDSLRHYRSGRMGLFDVTTRDNGLTWHAVHLSQVFKNRGVVVGSSGFSFDNYVQASRDPAGESVFVTWVDDTTVSSGTSNMAPDLYFRGLRVSDYAMTPEDNSPTRSDVNYGRRVYFPSLAPVCLTGDGGSFTLPVAFAEIPNGENNETFFHFIGNLGFRGEDFELPAADVAIVEMLEPQVQLCYAGETPVRVTLRNEGTAPISESFEIAFSVNGGEPVVETVVLTRPLEPGATMEYVFRRAASVEASGRYEFYVETHLTGDIVFYNHRRTFSVTNFGGLGRRIFPSSSLVGCGVLTVDTGLEGLPTTWTLDGDRLPFAGNRIVLQRFDLPTGSGQLQVTVRNDQCNPATLTETIALSLGETPVLDVPATAAICQDVAPLVLSLSSNPKPEYAYSWEEIDGSRAAQFNEYQISRSGRFRVRILNTQTGCDTTSVVDARVWNVSLALSASAQVCAPYVLDAQNETTSPDVRYVWRVNGNVVYDGPSSQLVTTVDTGGTAAKVYHVTAFDPMGCNAENPATSQVTVATFAKGFDENSSSRDTLLSYYEANYPFSQLENLVEVCCCKHLILRSMPDVGITPITHRYWVLTGVQGINEFDELIVSGEKGSATVPGSDSLVIKVPCASRFGRDHFRIAHIVRSGPCNDTIMRRVHMIRPDSEAQCPKPDLINYPDLDSRENLGTEEGWLACGLVGTLSVTNNGFGLTVYPNPGAGSYQVELQLEKSGEIQLQLFDLQGRVVWSRTEFGAQQHVSRMDVEHLPTGIYLLKVRTPQGFQTVRIIQQ